VQSSSFHPNSDPRPNRPNVEDVTCECHHSPTLTCNLVVVGLIANHTNQSYKIVCIRIEDSIRLGTICHLTEKLNEE